MSSSMVTHMTMIAFLLVSALLIPLSNAQFTYALIDDYTSSPDAFFESFNFFTGADPTNGFVSYTGLTAAAEASMIGYIVPDNANSSLQSANISSSSIYIGVDHTNVITTGTGRPSVRIVGGKSYNASILLVADILHMPTGCGTWSSLWMLGGAESNDWPVKGEIDIIENVNQATTDLVTLHTNAGCLVANNSGSTSFTGTMMTDNCDVNAVNQNKNQGCTIEAPNSFTSSSFGAGFNVNGGGVYAVEWTTAGFSIWFFSRTTVMPLSLLTNSPDTSTFGTPIAQFGGTGCDFERHFQDMSIILDTTFCGDWAGQVWESGGCAAATGMSTCQSYVAQNPEKFMQAYWNIRGLRVYEKHALLTNTTVSRRSLERTPPTTEQKQRKPLCEPCYAGRDPKLAFEDAMMWGAGLLSFVGIFVVGIRLGGTVIEMKYACEAERRRQMYHR